MENNVRIISNQADLEQYFSELCRDIVKVSDPTLIQKVE